MRRYAAALAPIEAAIVELRGEAGAAARVLAAAGLMAPNRPNSAAGTVLWLGPRRWLVLAPRAAEDVIAAILEEVAAREPLLLAVAVSDMFAGLALRGSGAGQILAQGTPLDLDALPDDAATMTELFAVAGLVRRVSDGFDLWVDRCLGEHVEQCLRVANGEEE